MTMYRKITFDNNNMIKVSKVITSFGKYGYKIENNGNKNVFIDSNDNMVDVIGPNEIRKYNSISILMYGNDDLTYKIKP